LNRGSRETFPVLGARLAAAKKFVAKCIENIQQSDLKNGGFSHFFSHSSKMKFLVNGY
jgi:hypothetical protein